MKYQLIHFSVKKSDLTGSVSSIKAEKITKPGSIGVDQALAGKAPGVVVTQSSGAPYKLK